MLSVTHSDLGGEPCPESISTSRILTVSLDSAKRATGYGSLWSLQGSPSENDAFISVGVSGFTLFGLLPVYTPKLEARLTCRR